MKNKTTAPGVNVEELSADAARSLLGRLANPKALRLRDEEGHTALTRAIEANDWEMVKFLEPGSDLLATVTVPVDGKNGRNPMRITPLMLAARLGRVECVQALINRQAESQCTQGGAWGELPPAIDQAIRFSGSVECVQLLAPWSNIKTRRQRSPLILAAQFGRLAIAQALLPLCDLNARDDEGYSAMHMAALSGANDCLRWLMEQPGAQVVPAGEDSPDNPVAQILLDTIREGNLEALQLLAPHFDLNATWHVQASGCWIGRTTALLHAAERSSQKCFEFLAPLCEASLGAVNERAPRKPHCPTAFELAFAAARNPFGGQDAKLIAMADDLGARMAIRGIHLIFPTGDPWGVDGRASQEEALARLPKTRAALEARALQVVVEQGQSPRAAEWPSAAPAAQRGAPRL